MLIIIILLYFISGKHFFQQISGYCEFFSLQIWSAIILDNNKKGLNQNLYSYSIMWKIYLFETRIELRYCLCLSVNCSFCQYWLFGFFTEYLFIIQCGGVPTVQGRQADQAPAAGLHHTSASLDIPAIFQGTPLLLSLSPSLSLSPLPLSFSNLSPSPSPSLFPHLSLSLSLSLI